MSLPPPQAILFDFDGTFADTAPDMAFAANLLRKARGMDTLPILTYRPHVSRGARGMVKVALGITPDDAQFTQVRDEFLDTYEKNLCIHTTFFDGMDAVVNELEKRNIRWGIVTNKAKRFTEPLTKQLGLDLRAGCVVCGDTTPHTKPHPAPLLHAADLLAVDPRACWYVGDDERDIVAAHAAGMRSVVAMYGYLDGSDPKTWEAGAAIHTAAELIGLLNRLSAHA